MSNWCSRQDKACSEDAEDINESDAGTFLLVRALVSCPIKKIRNYGRYVLCAAGSREIITGRLS